MTNEMTPQRIQRKRTKGWKAPANTLNATRPGAHGNPYPMESEESESEREKCISDFVDYLDKMETKYPKIYAALLAEVHAADYIMCWCPLDKPCHVDIWIKRAE